MPFKDLFGSLDSLAGGALSDAVSSIANQTSLDETIGSFVSGVNDLENQAQDVAANASDAATSAVDAVQGDFAGMAQEATADATAEFEGMAQDAAAGFEDVTQGSIDQMQDGLNTVIDGAQRSLSDMNIDELASGLSDAISGSVGDILGGLFNR